MDSWLGETFIFSPFCIVVKGNFECAHYNVWWKEIIIFVTAVITKVLSLTASNTLLNNKLIIKQAIITQLNKLEFFRWNYPIWPILTASRGPVTSLTAHTVRVSVPGADNTGGKSHTTSDRPPLSANLWIFGSLKFSNKSKIKVPIRYRSRTGCGSVWPSVTVNLGEADRIMIWNNK